MDVKFDFSDVDSIIANFKRDVVMGKMSEIGAEAVEYAKTNGDYHDKSGKLRKSTRSEVDEKGLTIYNDADYAF